jgi:peptidoglycan/LPS O-acetylase OafA/YrhL
VINNSHRIFGLDIIRAFAILFVIFEHGHTFFSKYIDRETYLIPALDGVTIFFVLSGFLIGTILLKIVYSENGLTYIELLNFWIQRWFRTIPNYFLILTILISLQFLPFFKNSNPADIEYYKFFLFSQNIFTPHPHFFGEAWSLCVEEWFYLLIPLCICLSTQLTQISKNKIILFWIAFIIISVTLIRVIRVIEFGQLENFSWDNDLRKQVITRLDSLMFGVLMAYLIFHKYTFLEKRKNVLVIIGCCLLIYPQIHPWLFKHDVIFKNYLLFTCTSLGSMFLIPKMLSINKPLKGVLLFRFITFTSLTSYSMYLLNRQFIRDRIIPLLCSFFPSLNNSSLHICILKYLLYWTLTFLFSYILYTYYETRMTKLRDRFKFN